MIKVQRSQEWRRVDAIPRRLMPTTCKCVGSEPGAEFRRTFARAKLRPVQAWALNEIKILGGLLGAIGVGEGKTLVTLLAPGVLQAKRPLLILPAGLLRKTEREIESYARDWDFDPPQMISYERLSRAGAADFLSTFQPDAVICDEAHRLKNPKAAATRRLHRYVRERNRAGVRVPCVFLSGTITRRSLRDYWHLACMALVEPPLPRSWPEVAEWADAVDEGVEPWARPDPGPLLEWGPADEPDPVRRARLGYQDRLRSTPGVVVTSETSVGASLQIGFRVVDMPDKVSKAIQHTEETWTRPDGWEFCDALSRETITRQLALGFYYKWRVEPPKAWRQARSTWCQFVRDNLRGSRKLDTEQQVALACKRGDLDAAPWQGWCQVRDTFRPETECVWLDNFALSECSRWIKEQDAPALVWTEHKIFGQALVNWAHNAVVNKVRRVEYFGEQGLNRDGTPIEAWPGHAVLSVQANKEGRNLQAWSRNLVTSPMKAADHWEQLLGRTHRPGQRADTVCCDVFVTHALHVESFAAARAGARYLQDTLGQRQKILYADIITTEVSTS